MLVCSCLAAGAASAVVNEDSDAPVMHIGAAGVYPGISLVEKHNDNLFRSDANKHSSSITVLSPSVLMQTKSGANAYSLGYNLDIGRYSQSTADNYTDQNLSAIAELALSSQAKLKLVPQYKIGHDDRGSTYSTMTPDPNTWHNSGVDGTFTYGTEEAIGRVVLGVKSYSVRYQNNRSITTSFDKDLNGGDGTFYYHVSPKTSVFAQLSDLQIKYANDFSLLNGSEQRALLGVEWKATAQTSGSFKVGQLQKKFDSASRHSFTGTSWEGSMRWSPREFIRLDWVSGRTPTESTGVGNFILITNNSLDFGYDLSGQSTLHLTAADLTEEFFQAGRRDNTPSYGIKAEYKLRKWLALNAGYTNSIKSSTGYAGTSPNYDAKIFSVGINTLLE
jgi:hypothetical protein